MAEGWSRGAYPLYQYLISRNTSHASQKKPRTFYELLGDARAASPRLSDLGRTIGRLRGFQPGSRAPATTDQPDQKSRRSRAKISTESTLTTLSMISMIRGFEDGEG